MNWTVLIPIILQYGLPFAEGLWQRFTAGTPVTQADWDALKLLSLRTPESLLAQAATSAGIPLNDPHYLAVLALVQANAPK